MKMRERKQSRMLKAFYAFLIAAGALLLLGTGASAAPALGLEQQFSQPDGATFRGTLRGDEFFHFVEAQDGSILTQDDDGYWRHAGEEELAAARREAPVPQAIMQAAQPSYLGNQNVLVILVDFNDVRIRYEDQWAERMFGSTGKTVKTFYNEATGGKINIVPARETYGAQNDGVVRVQLSRSHPGTKFSDTNDVADVMAAAGSYVNFASYDADGNGRISADELHVVIVYAGYEAAYSANRPGVWAHQSGTAVAAAGKTFCSYLCFGERQGDHMATIGTLCHELGHDLGLPDLYCNSAAPAERDLIGISVMGSGWGALAGEYPGETPVLLDAYCLERLGAVTPQAVSPGQALTTQVKSWSSSGKNTLKVVSGVPNEYFLIECRNREGFDSSIYGKGGVAVYRVNTDNTDNLEPGCFLVDWLWLDANAFPSEASAGSLFYSARPSGRTYIDANTIPSNQLSGRGGYSWFRFDCLSDSGPSMNVKLQPDKPGGVYAVSYDANGGSGGPALQLKKHGEALVLSGQAPTRAGYTFLGWSIGGASTALAYQPNGNFALDADTALYAVWEEVVYTFPQQLKGIFGVNPRWDGAFWHYILFFIGFGWLWMWL